MKEFKTSKGSFLAVKVPEKASDFYVFNDKYDPYLFYKIKHETGRIHLDYAKYSIIGLLSEITEEQAKEVVDKEMMKTFIDYTQSKVVDTYCLYSALESFNSLMQANEIDLNGNWLILKKES